MLNASRRPFWAGRALALCAIVLLALNLRTAVTALSPIVGFIDDDIPLDPFLLGVLGMLAPLAFASGGLFAPALTRRFGLEVTLVGACVVMIAGPLVRASATSPAVLLLGTAGMFLGVGIGNVLLPPAVKRYFPDRIGLLTAVYVTLLSLSTAVPPAVAVPIAEAGGWRLSLGVWALLGLMAAIPWVLLWMRAGRAKRLEAGGVRGGGAPRDATRELGRRLRKSPIAWAMVLGLAVNSLNSYAMFAWLPQLLIERAGLSPAAAGAALAIYAFVGLPVSLTVPVLAARMRSVAPMIYVAACGFLLGYAGLLLAPSQLTLLWVVLAGLGTGFLFPVVLLLINLRTRTPAGSVALSGFTQGLGYTAAALGPLLVGLLRDVTGGWNAPLIFLLLTALLAVVSGLVLKRHPGYVEDEPAAGAAR